MSSSWYSSMPSRSIATSRAARGGRAGTSPASRDSRACVRGSLREPDRHVGHVLHRPLEVVRRERVDVHVRRRIHEVDRVRHAVAHRPLERVHVVAERAHERQRILDDARAELGRQMLVLDEVLALACGSYFIGSTSSLPEAQAADELVPLDELLHDHREQAGRVVVVDQLLQRAADVDVASSRRRARP